MAELQLTKIARAVLIAELLLSGVGGTVTSVPLELKLSNVSGTVTSVPLELRLSKVGGAVTSTLLELRLSNIAGTVTSNPLKLRVTEVGGLITSTTIPVVNAGPNQSVEPLTAVTLPVSATNSPTSYSVTQASGPAVVLSGPGTSSTFQAPRVLSGATLVFSVTASNSAGTSPPSSVTVVVYPHLYWVLTAGAWLPANESSLF